jgi:uncharacterized membrane protein YkvA (DUF1232 family)
MQRVRDWARRLKAGMLVRHAPACDPRRPGDARVVVAAIVADALSPSDLSPDFVPALGLRDEVGRPPLGLALALRMLPARAMAEPRGRAAAECAGAQPRRSVGAAAILAIGSVLAVFCGVLDGGALG